MGAVDLAVTVGHGWKGVSHLAFTMRYIPFTALIKVSTRPYQPVAQKRRYRFVGSAKKPPPLGAEAADNSEEVIVRYASVMPDS